ncbi:MAG: nitroimidazol reductase NimA-like FMN-containing flavoprotein [Candidatus Aldehydirespiratoraceae bacterium]|jgi:nitroimidazol reductase NimA-like FMN-containing flavoprotein (pyridoxamine 5'-phosphate oxidase superfamily)
MADSTVPAPSARTTVRRGANRALYEQDNVKLILDAGMIAHVGVQTPDGPLVLPMAYGRDDDTLYLHGAAANHILGTGIGHQICATVTHVDGLVMARTPFHNSMNYRSVVVRGLATKIEDKDAKLRALKIITDHVVENWDVGRAVSNIDEKKTLVLEMPLAEASAKVRAGDPIDEDDDMAGPWWAGVIPIETRIGEAYPAADLTGTNPLPAAYASLTNRVL